ncbi:2-enoyl thioester reductase domain-containing protein [Prosthecobacter sp.]|uniref:MDR family NADPH-dependent oxidoreductase n=1 Tax=Prosthecobacter sp. TaxID=1965333 RepID=UPI001DE29BE5|nr:2-enoyl thioester reductase domain-containing protein [Prosthecobacter sp.]MCB1279305.1 2-enoyl thioester reductase domain-containing protein [Prosthecobacter sp.]
MSQFLQFDHTGNPAEVLQLKERELAPPEGHEVRVRMRYAPVNPADLNFIEGTYGRAANPPCITGHEGCGEVEEVGSAVTSLAKGDVVIPLLGTGCWTQHLTAPERHFAKLPPQIDRVQASMLRINPVTAWALLKHYTTLEKGAWVAQNAANSGVGRAFIQLAHHFGLRTINFVRRAELFDELKSLGADVVVLDTDEGVAEAKKIVGHEPVKLATNAVGGDSAIHLMDLLSPGGILVTYGAMSRRSLKVPNKFLIFKNLQLHGLWITKWLEGASTPELYEVLEPLTELIETGELVTAIDEIVPLADFKRAIARAQEGSRHGKVILDLA